MKQLRFTTTKPMPMLGIMNPEEDHAPLALPKEIGELIKAELKGGKDYIHGEAESLAEYDIPTFIDGDMAQLAAPINEQDILMLLPSGEYKCKSEYCNEWGARNSYLITLATEPLAMEN